ncbi:MULTISPECIES: MarR family winged helix-turn-helix transcriptional regulator [unclassified Beijerinckia]|uniref:MarR family winged helix-turn-helix transcriptional regulator n=1 Tax=unclassified Beijerinckia TaxID=2638183 RepID=UPI0008991C8B|nr:MULTISPECIES: MarR family winged helix-turn-helix transcriptional regulator [unclassified Beijerinckia]MDH7796839.1 DNA-binding MarR family transcriptional regulator [Beijerinckia sp. GAS462]SEC61914.1 DNA-binding transcriptional regulator, MarR family [Beijerinckia sp. 28-YEA-48]
MAKAATAKTNSSEHAQLGDVSEAVATALDLNVYVPHHLTVIANRWARGSSRIYLKRFGIGVNEWRIIAMIAVEPGVTAQRAGFVTSVDKGIVSRAVKEMEAQGLVTADQDQDDARKTSLTLTKKGYALHDRVVAVALERQNRLLHGLSQDEILQLARLLGRIRENLPAVNAPELERDTQASKAKRGK